MLGGGVLGQFLSFSKAKQYDARVGCAKEGPADDAVRGKPGFSGQGKNSLPVGLNQRFLCHATTLPKV